MRIKKMVVISVLCSMIFCAGGAVHVKKIFAAQTDDVKNGHTGILERIFTDSKEKLYKWVEDVIIECVPEDLLMYTAKNGYTDILERLLQRGIKVDAQDNDGVTALMHAASAGDTKTVKILLKHGANINVQDNEGYTALMLTDDDEIEKILREFGAK